MIQLQVLSDHLAVAWHNVALAVSKDDNDDRNVVHLEAYQGRLCLVATNGVRLHYAELVPVSPPPEDLDVSVVPTQFLNLVIDQHRSDPDMVTIEIDDAGSVRFHWRDTAVLAERGTAKFPERWRELLTEKPNKKRTTVDIQQRFLKDLGRMKSIDDRGSAVSITLLGGENDAMAFMVQSKPVTKGLIMPTRIWANKEDF